MRCHSRAPGDAAHLSANLHNTVTWLYLVFGILIFLLTDVASSQSITVNLGPYGFPSGKVDLPSDVFYISSERLALFFDRGEASDSSVQNDLKHRHQFLVLVFSVKGQLLARQTVYGLPKAVDIKPGPGGGLTVGREGKAGFYDPDLGLKQSMALSSDVTGISFNRRLNQLVIATLDDTLQSRTIRLLDGTTREVLESFTIPKTVAYITGNREIAFSTGGNCANSTRIISRERSWGALKGLPICGFTTFVGDDALAYTFDRSLYVVNNGGKQLLRESIPAFDDMDSPFFAGISDDNSRLAIEVWKSRVFRKPGDYPKYKEVFVYDLPSHKRLLSIPLTSGTTASALSPDGKQLATIDDDLLKLIPIP